MERWLARELNRADSSLVAFWPLLKNANDYSGNGLNLLTGSFEGARHTYEYPRLSGAGGRKGLRVDGLYAPTPMGPGQGLPSTDVRFWYSDAAPVNHDQGHSGLTISCWVWRDPSVYPEWAGFVGTPEALSGGFIFCKNNLFGGSRNQGWSLIQLAYGRIAFSMNDPEYDLGGGEFAYGPYLSTSPTPHSFQCGRWSHVAVTYDGSGLATGVKIYLDGRNREAEVASEPYASYQGSGDNPYNYTIGDSLQRSSVSLVRHYKRCLSGSEIGDLYRRERFVQNWKPFAAVGTSANRGLTHFLHGYDSRSSSITIASAGHVTASGVAPLALPKAHQLRTAYVVPEGTPFGMLLALTQPEADSAPSLYVDGHTPWSSGLDLFSHGNAAITQQVTLHSILRNEGSGDATLFSGGLATASGSAALYVPGSDHGDWFEGIDLVVAGGLQSSGHAPLFVQPLGHAADDFTLHLNGPESFKSGSATLYARGYHGDPAATRFTGRLGDVDSVLDRIVLGYLESNLVADGMTLFMYATAESGMYDYVPLYTISSQPASTGVPLAAWGYAGETDREWFASELGVPRRSMLGNIVFGQRGEEAGRVRHHTLFVRGIDAGRANLDRGYDPVTPLYTLGDVGNDSAVTLYVGETPLRRMPLFLKADDTDPHSSGSFPLYADGATQDKLARFAPLYVGSVDQRTASGTMNLFAESDTSARSVRNLNLFARGVAHTASAATDLFLGNTQAGATRTSPLLIVGYGKTAGAAPYDRGMNLFLKRDPAAAMALHTTGPGAPAQSGVSIYAQGAYGEFDSLDLSVPSVLGFSSSRPKLFTSGW